MAETPWDELGIPSTTDEVAIRRAYAKRLKGLDVDREPGAFMLLRQAYEDALAEAHGDEAVVTDVIPRGERATGQAVSVPPQDLVEQLPSAAPAEFRAAFSTLVEAGDSRAAIAGLNAALAQGVVPIGEEVELLQILIASVLADETATAEELEEVGRLLAGAATTRGSDRLSELQRDLRARVDAMRWWAKIESGGHWDGDVFHRSARRRARVALAIRDARIHGLGKRDLPELRTEVSNARRHAPWLGGRVDLQRLEESLDRFERKVQPKLWRSLLALALIVAAGLIAQGDDTEVPALAMAGLALVAAGGWFFLPFGVAVLLLVAWLTVT